MYYWYFLGLLVLCAMFSAWASRKVHSSYQAFANKFTRSHYTGYDTAVRLLRANGIEDVSVSRVGGSLTDHFHPKKKVVNLSDTTYGSTSVAAVAVAAHEIGHVVQKQKGYLPYQLRTVLVPLTNFGSYLALPLVILGVAIELTIASGSSAGFGCALVGVVLYGLSTLFTLVTLPVELDASRRAKEMLVEEGILTESELPGAKKVLSAAALTYVAALATSLVYFLRFLYWVLLLFGRNRD